MTINNIRDAARMKQAHWQSEFLDSSNTYWMQMVGSGGRTGAAMALTGLRLSWSSGNFAAGGAVTLWGSP